MHEFFSVKSIKILTATLAVILVLSIMGATGNNFVASGFNFLTKGLSQLTAAASDFSDKKSYEELEAENSELRKEAADLRTQLVDYYDTLDENARLWRYYQLKKNHADFEIMPASVIRRDTGDDFYSFTIDVGTSSGIAVNDPVVTENGLVGFVSSADAAVSHVTTILSPDLKAGAVDKKSGDTGVVSGSALYTDRNKTTFTKIDANAVVKKGDIITTSGIGGLYPADLIVGKVSDIRYDKYDATKYAVIQPYEDIKKVTDVVVITDFKNKGRVEKIEKGEK